MLQIARRMDAAPRRCWGLLLFGLSFLMTGGLSCGGRDGLLHGAGAGSAFTRAKQEYESGNYLRAIELLVTFEREHPGSQYIDDALYYLGRAHQGNHEQLLARQSFERLLRAYPRSSYAEMTLFEIARSWYMSMRGPALDPEPTESAHAAFLSYLRRYPEGQFRAEAQEAVGEILDRLAEKDYLNGHTYLRLRRPAAARRYFRKSLDTHAEAQIAARAREGIARSYEKDRNWSEARTAYQALLDHLGDDPGRFEDGVEIADKARARLASLPN